MLKKKLVNENLALFERLNKANEKISEQGKTIKELEEKISELKILLEEEKNKVQVIEIKEEAEISTAEETKEEIKSVNDVEYGSAIIGKIVVAATENSNKLSAESQTPESKEQINLILGKTEVAKSEILAVVLSNKSLDEKIADMDKIREDTVEYFEGIMQQYQ
ncbi:MAG: hypothetical protein UHX92_05140 [Acutalibacteraceae bacterium]|nr:hypothetical protein [Acutalibacteraceae bacterium]